MDIEYIMTGKHKGLRMPNTGISPAKGKTWKWKGHRDKVLEKLEFIYDEFRTSLDTYNITHLLSDHAIPKSTFYGWRTEIFKDDEEICGIIELLCDMSIAKLERNALDGTINPWFTKFMLSSHYGMAETNKQEITKEVKHTGNVTVIIEGSEEVIDV